MSSPEQRQPTPFDLSIVRHGAKLTLHGEPVHVRGIEVAETRLLANYFRAQQLHTPDGQTVVPALQKIYVPHTEIDIAASFGQSEPVLRPRNWRRFPPEAQRILQDQHAQPFKITELHSHADYLAAAQELQVDPQGFFTTMSQTGHMLCVSEWVGPNLADRILECEHDQSTQEKIGQALGITLGIMHKGGLVNNDLYINQFVVPPDDQYVKEIDLNHLVTSDPHTEHNEVYGIVRWLTYNQRFMHAARAFHASYQTHRNNY